MGKNEIINILLQTNYMLCVSSTHTTNQHIFLHEILEMYRIFSSFLTTFLKVHIFYVIERGFFFKKKYETSMLSSIKIKIIFDFCFKWIL